MRTDSYPLHDPGGLGIFSLMATAMTPPPFQPDFRARWDRHDPVPPATPAKVSAPEQDGAPAPRRGLMERLERWFWAQRQRDAEAYLARSTDVHDLETRIRELEHEPLHPYY